MQGVEKVAALAEVGDTEGAVTAMAVAEPEALLVEVDLAAMV